MSKERKNIIIISRLILVVFIIIAMRFFYLQIFKSDELQEKVAEQRVKEITEVPERGKIIDRNGNVLAMSLMAQDIAVYPNLITSDKRKDQIAALLSETLKLPYEDVLKKINTKKADGSPAMWVSIAKRVEPEKAYFIKKKNIGGIEISQSPTRYYPNGELASSIIGFVNSEGQPGSGLEVSMNSYLSGVPGFTIAETDNVGKKIPIGFQNVSSAIDGQNVQLTTDNYIQYVLEKHLKNGFEEMEANSIHGVVMNPNTGEILAMSSYPSFDPTEYSKSDPSTWTKSPATFVYEPGSTFKPTVMATALEYGTINGNSTWFDGEGSIVVNGSRIKNFDSRALGEMTLEDIIINSSNVGMIHIVNTLNNENLLEGLRKAGFGSKTGVEYPGEEIGLFPNANKDKEDWNSLYNDPIRKATVSFGQGISITPLQLITGFSSIINGGYKVNAKLVENVIDNYGNILYEHSEKEKTRIYSEKTSKLMKSYLKANMVEGSGKNYQIEGYDGGGKTGSAWVVENGVYKDGAIIGSFMGYAPQDNPQLATLIVVDDPKGIEFGGPAAGPIFNAVMTESLRYLNVKKVDGKESKEIEVPNTENMIYDLAKEKLEKEIKGNKLKIKKVGNGEVVTRQTYTYKQKQLIITLETTKIYDDNTLTMPILNNLTKDEISDLFKPYNINIKYYGEGKVKEQSIKPGVLNTKKDIELKIWLN